MCWGDPEKGRRGGRICRRGMYSTVTIKKFCDKMNESESFD